MYRVFVVLLLVAAVIAISCARGISPAPEMPAFLSSGHPSLLPVESRRTEHRFIISFEAKPV